MNHPFTRFIHRAHDVSAARTFYTAVLGNPNIEISSVPKAAAERGAPAHWLGAIGVDDVEQTLTQLVASGCTQLGPLQRDERGAFATARDPGGALVALTTTSSAPPSVEPVWCHLDARDALATFAVYARLFGWRSLDAAPPASSFVRFAWEEGGASVGSYADIAARLGIHPQWVFHFQVAAFDSAVEAVRAHGGTVMANVTAPNGARVAVCDDPQGGGFAMSSGRLDG